VGRDFGLGGSGGWELVEKEGWLVEWERELFDREGWDERGALNNDDDPRPLEDTDILGGS